MKERGSRSEAKAKTTIQGGSRIRRAMLAKVHIAKKELGLKQHEYAAILEGYNVPSAADLSFKDLDELIKFFKFLGWQSKPNAQIKVLQQRVRDAILTIQNGENRLTGLIKKICGVERLEWCRSVTALERLLAVMTKISEGEKNEAERIIQQDM